MQLERSTSDAPKIARPDYATYYDAPVVPVTWQCQDWLMGTGISAIKHPLRVAIRMWHHDCAQCEAPYNWGHVIAARHVISPINGDIHWEYEFRCEVCGVFNQLRYTDKI